MKKLVSVLLALILTLSCAFAALAADCTEYDTYVELLASANDITLTRNAIEDPTADLGAYSFTGNGMAELIVIYNKADNSIFKIQVLITTTDDNAEADGELAGVALSIGMLALRAQACGGVNDTFTGSIDTVIGDITQMAEALGSLDSLPLDKTYPVTDGSMNVYAYDAGNNCLGISLTGTPNF